MNEGDVVAELLLPAHQDTAEVLEPCHQALHLPAATVTAERPAVQVITIDSANL